MIKITKFGGSSLADAKQFKKVKEIIKADQNRRFVVVSAAGKRDKEDNKITDLLYLCHAHMTYHVSSESVFAIIEERFLQIKRELNLHYPIEKELLLLKEQLQGKISLDYLVSRGEYLTALLMAEYLQYDFVDAKDIICFHYDGNIDFDKTKEACDTFLETHHNFVIPGFYGAYPDGDIRILSRGGSDITGSILARIINADMYENWTDVSGILMADPRIVHHPKQIEKITYSELRELSYMGANVLHEDAIFPVKDKNIPINILNTNHPEEAGTIIVDTADDLSSNKQIITGIAGKKDFSVVAIYKNHMSNEVGIIKRALEVFEKYHISIEHIPSGIDSFSVVVNSTDIQNNKYDIVADIKKMCGCDKVKVIDEIALIATVGRHMSSRPGMSGKLFKVLGENNINIRMIAQGSDEINIIVGVENRDFEKTIAVIYESFVI